MHRTNLANPKNWQSMAGETPLEKMLNAYLTTRFVSLRSVPPDECLSEAKNVIRITQAYGESADSGAAWDELGRVEFPEPVRERDGVTNEIHEMPGNLGPDQEHA